MNLNFFKEHKKLFIFLAISLILIIVLPLFLLVKFFLLAILSVILFMNLDFFKIFFKKHKILSVFLIIFYVFIISTSVFLLVKSIQVSTMDAPTERHYVTYMKGIVEPAAQVFITPEDLAQMKEDNMNTITIYPSTYLPSSLSFLYKIEKIFLIGLTKEAKKQGFAIRVSGQSGPSPPSEEDFTDKRLDVITARVLEWAEISEELGVEYFIPWAEVDAIGRNRAVEWHKEILPQVREVFSGKVMAGWANYGDDDMAEDILRSKSGGEFTMCDSYVFRVRASKDFDGVMLDFASPTPFQFKYMFDASKEKEEGDDYRPCSLEEIVIATSEAADEIGIPIYVGEFYVETGEAPFGLNSDRLIFNEQEQAEYIGTFLDIVMPHYDGIIHCSWFSFMCGIKDTPAEQVIKEKFGEY